MEARRPEQPEYPIAGFGPIGSAYLTELEPEAMDLDGEAGENEVIRLLRRQAVVARGRERVRLAAAVSVGPAALAGSVLISATGFTGPGSAAAAFILFLFALGLLVAVAG